MASDYVLEAVVGSGTFGDVYRAHSKTSPAQILAIKRFKNVYGMGIDSTSIREVSNLRALQHPNIVKIIEASFDANNDMLLVMEMCDQSLFHYMLSFRSKNGTAIPRSEALLFFKQLCTGLHWIHAHKFMHRDIKPSNLLVNDDKTLKICDFGLSRYIAYEQLPLTKEVMSRWYRAPEVLLGVTYAFSADIWSAGCVLAEIQLSYAPFQSETDIGVLKKIFEFRPPTEREFDLMRSASTVVADHLRNSSTARGGTHACADQQLIFSAMAYNPTERLDAKKLSRVAAQLLKLIT